MINGARWSAVAAGIKTASNDEAPALDIALLELAEGSTVAAVFTRNAFCAAPVTVARSRLQDVGREKNNKTYCLINAGNANAGTGDAGVEAVHASSGAIARALACSEEQILPFSTGVIGEPLPVDAFERSAKALVKELSEDGWADAARAIMTTDTVPKQEVATIQIDGQAVEIAGIAKGAGMIKPNMATMLAYIVCDASVDQSSLDASLQSAVKQSFNRITVDGDTSTNDACVLAATSKGVSITQSHPQWTVFVEAVSELFCRLAKAIIRDAEGASKFIQIDVNGGANSQECLSVAYAVAESPLVKTAFFASDANWGRILAAVGRSGVEDLDVNKITIALDGYIICHSGGRHKEYDEVKASEIMQKGEITLTISLGRGDACETVWTSDLSHDYVRINAEYRT